MKKLTTMLLAAVLALTVTAQEKDVVDIAISSKDHTTLVTALKSAGLVETLKGDGPFTIFAPTNAAFDKLPDGTVSSLLKPENKDLLTNILTYHVVSGKIVAADVLKAIKAGDGKADLVTLQGSNLTATLEGEKVKLTDVKGNVSFVIATDLSGSNGVIHVIDSVVMPN